MKLELTEQELKNLSTLELSRVADALERIASVLEARMPIPTVPYPYTPVMYPLCNVGGTNARPVDGVQGYNSPARPSLDEYADTTIGLNARELGWQQP